ncbi:MAG: hypothetical protein CM15mP79_0930 [Methanobacteriota archaeon]|nr:MAG: hypothetical protein CM15mP79_0930 [Euryarchaeota archaeon]
MDADTYAIHVVNGGTVIADDARLTSTAPVTSQGSHGSGLWPGLVVDSSSSAFLNGTVIERAETCLHLEGTLEANDLTLQNCYIGLDVTGSATAEVDTLHVEQADVFAVRNKGTLTCSTRLVCTTCPSASNPRSHSTSRTSGGGRPQGVKAVSGTPPSTD